MFYHRSTSPKYAPLQGDFELERQAQGRVKNVWLIVLIILLTCSNTFLAGKIFWDPERTPKRNSEELDISPFTGLDRAEKDKLEGYRVPDYTDMLKSEDAWNEIEGAHGVIAVDHTWAATHHLPPSVTYANDTSKSVYIIAAYHAMHCVILMREKFVTLLHGEPLTSNTAEHAFHCFDIVREELMCTADDTPLAIKDFDQALGAGQNRQCYDWGAIRDFASARPSHYALVKDRINDESIYTYDDGGTDGLILP